MLITNQNKAGLKKNQPSVYLGFCHGLLSFILKSGLDSAPWLAVGGVFYSENSTCKGAVLSHKVRQSLEGNFQKVKYCL